MSTRGGRFTQQEVAYLQSTAAVDRATTSRITYSAAFKRESLRRYLNGESPVKLFREAGLPPELVGYKRIGRAFSRWKENKDAILSAEPEDDQQTVLIAAWMPMPDLLRNCRNSMVRCRMFLANIVCAVSMCETR